MSGPDELHRLSGPASFNFTTNPAPAFARAFTERKQQTWPTTSPTSVSSCRCPRIKAITIHRLSLQFDAGQVTRGDDDNQAREAVKLINLILRREPFGLGAQLFIHPDEIEVEAHPIDPSA